MNVGEALQTIPAQLDGDWPELDAQLILADALDKPRTWLLAHPETRLSTSQLESVESGVARLKAGEPLPHILGHWEFFGLDLEITPDVLIPRPETELLVEKAIVWLQANPDRNTVADVGTGSGAIAVVLAVHVPKCHILATDISSSALEVAKRNAKKHKVQHRIDFVECDLLPPSPASPISLLCANLPYIPTQTLAGLEVFGREPTVALDGGEDGLHPFRRLLQIAPHWLTPNGCMLLEIEASLGQKAIRIASQLFPNAAIRLHQDLAGRDRLIEITLHES